VRRSHLAAFAPVCPCCRSADASHPLRLARVLQGDAELVEQGLLLCSNPLCQREYPILDGVPILVRDIRAYVSHALLHLLARDDVDPVLMGVIGDCAGPESPLHTMRSHLSYYAEGHYSDLDRERPRPPAILELVERALTLLPAPPVAPVVVLGCSVGRECFALAGRVDGLVLGLDLNFSMLRLAARVARAGRLRYARRRVGLVFDPVDVAVAMPGAERVDFWMADASALPLADGAAAFATSLNLVDCVPDPHAHVHELDRLVRPGGAALLATPYDWSPAATPLEGWLGGHSQRGPHDGDPEPVLRGLFDPDGPQAVPGLRIVAEAPDLPWEVTLHRRGALRYRVHALALMKERLSAPTGTPAAGTAPPECCGRSP